MSIKLGTIDLAGTISDTTKADKSNVLELDGTTTFTPTADYQPATKKYVDDNAGGGGGGSLDFSFPHAKTNFIPFAVHITNIITYTPPSGKVLYITQATDIAFGTKLQINSIDIGLYGYSSGDGRIGFYRPIIISDTDVIKMSASSTGYIAGFLIDESSDIIPTTTSGLYTVPAGKTYVINAMYTTTSSTTDFFNIGGVTYRDYQLYNAIDNSNVFNSINVPMLGSGDQVLANGLNHSGYLIDTINIS